MWVRRVPRVASPSVGLAGLLLIKISGPEALAKHLLDQGLRHFGTWWVRALALGPTEQLFFSGKKLFPKHCPQRAQALSYQSLHVPWLFLSRA